MLSVHTESRRGRTCSKQGEESRRRTEKKSISICMSPILPHLSELASHFIHSLTPFLSGTMHPQRPLPQAMPASPSSSSLGQQLRNMAMGLGRGKNLLGGNAAYGFVQSLKECLYFLLCCWCIKEILD
ncbi:lens epithelial cell protein LEP503 [Syngnathus typhle]|uniref:lens epithelial cell protein LEP503 n=1 Tax=Syngnathus typhle TaxID=161592 RepID=UPI002A6B6132|nr:lens epithelial cell protein LEP503 [Syngnathus typhle]